MQLQQACNWGLVNTFFCRATLRGSHILRRATASLWHPHLPMPLWQWCQGWRLDKPQIPGYSPARPCSRSLFCGHSLPSGWWRAFSKPQLAFPLHLRHTPAFSTGFGCPLGHPFTELPLRDTESKDFKIIPSFILLTFHKYSLSVYLCGRPCFGLWETVVNKTKILYPPGIYILV